jgi:hypothetical protein
MWLCLSGRFRLGAQLLSDLKAFQNTSSSGVAEEKEIIQITTAKDNNFGMGI